MSDSLNAKYAFAFGIDFNVNLPQCSLKTVRSYVGLSTATSHSAARMFRGRYFGRPLSPRIVFIVFRSKERSAAIDQGLKDLFHAPANLKDQISAILHLVVGEVIPKPAAFLVPRSRAQNTNRSGKSTAHRPGAIALQPLAGTRSLRSLRSRMCCQLL